MQGIPYGQYEIRFTSDERRDMDDAFRLGDALPGVLQKIESRILCPDEIQRLASPSLCPPAKELTIKVSWH